MTTSRGACQQRAPESAGDASRVLQCGAAETYEGWAILELMGQRRLAGLVSEAEVAGGKFLRIDVPGEEGPQATQFYAPGAIYCITPTTEEVARKIAVKPWGLLALLLAG